MRTGSILKFALTALCFLISASSNAHAWSAAVTADGIPIRGITNLSTYNGKIVATAENDVYLLRGAGFAEMISEPGFFSGITDVASDGGALYLASARGIFSYDGSYWRPVVALRGIKGIVPSGKSGIMASWDGRRVFLVSENSYEDITPPSSGNIVGAAGFRNRLYCLWDDALLSRSEDGRWVKHDLGMVDAGSEESFDLDDEEELYEESAHFRSIVANEKMLVVASAKDIFTKVSESWEALPIIGMSGEVLEVYLAGEEDLFVLTRKGVFLYLPDKRLWTEAATLMSDIDSIAALRKNRSLKVYAAGRNRLFYNEIDEKALSSFGGDASGPTSFRLPEAPAIRHVQEMAIEYAEVSDNKISTWRKNAAIKGILPRLSLRFGYDNTDNTRIYASASTNYIIDGPRRVGYDYTVGLDWDLSELVWNRDQTSIDTRSRLMVKLRVEILEEVNRLYFERERLIERIKDAGSDGTETDGATLIKLRELDAHLDALTGGGFSENKVYI